MAYKRTNDDLDPDPRTTGIEEVGLVLGTRIALIFGGLAIQSLLAYRLLPEGRGAYAICVMFGALFGVLFSPGIDRGVQYYLMAKKLNVSESVWSALVMCLIGSVIATAVAVPLILSDIPFFQKADRPSFFLSLPLIPLTALSTSIRLQLAGLRQFARLALFSVFQTVTNVLILTTLIVGLHLQVDGALAAAAISHALMIILMFRYLHRTYGIRVGLPSHMMFRRVVRYGLKYHFARIGQLVDVQIGTLFLGMVAGRAEIGLFTLASAVLTRMWILSEATASAVLPRVAADGDGRPALVSFCARTTSWTTGIALACLCAISVPLTRTLFSEAFLPAVPLMWIMAPGVLVYSGTSILMSYFRGINRPAVCSWSVWVGLLSNLITVALLYSKFGLVAAACGMVVGRVFRSIVVVLAFVKVAHVRPMCIWFPQSGDAKRIWNLGRTALGRAIPGLSIGT